MRASVIDLEVYLPDRRMTNADLEERITLEGSPLPSGTLDKLCGPIERRYAEPDVQVSDLACLAASRLMERNKNVPVDLIIFAAASSDLIEPATACIIRQKLNLSCPAFDLKNACNSVVSAMQTASAFVECGMYRHVLIVTGEKLSGRQSVQKKFGRIQPGRCRDSDAHGTGHLPRTAPPENANLGDALAALCSAWRRIHGLSRSGCLFF